MGKLVKYCGDCEEGFAERFGFCPNCGGELEAFELNPVVKETETAAIPVVDNSVTGNFAKTEETAPIAETPLVSDTMDFSGDDILELDSVDTRETAVENVEKVESFEKQPETLAATVASVSDGANNYQNYQSKDVSDGMNFYKSDANLDDYHVTVVSEQASSWFKPFLLSLMGLAFLAAISSYAIAIWVHGFQLPEIDGVGDVLYSSLADDNPLAVEEIEKKNDKKGGGGGGGGNENPDPASKGRMPTNGKPTPLMIVDRMDNPSLAINNRIQNNIERKDNGDVLGNGTADGRSSGSGRGKGIGTGLGTGVGSGNGTGEGRGDGSGSGNGVGTGNGNGVGIGDQDDTDTPKIAKKEKEKPVGVTKGMNIISKPRANYTDAARQNNVQGTISLRVVFNANGTIGSVSPVNSLPYGLTEKAIAAAKSITFEPATRNGQAVAVTKVVQYTFTIY